VLPHEQKGEDMRSIKLNMWTTRQALTVLCLGLLLSGCGLTGGHGSLDAGAKYQAEGKYRAAYIEAKKVLQHNNKDGAAWLLLGQASMMLGNPKEALNDLQTAQANGVPKAQWVVPMGQSWTETT
jgi:cytochrome c-type biogenesis protein CcmH/NrfG